MRGKIKHIKRAQQINDFTQLRLPSTNITPTDIDGMIEYRNQKYIFFEVKYMSTELPNGQRLALERLVRDTARSGKKSIAIVCQHEAHNTEEQVDVAKTVVREYFSYGVNAWYEPENTLTTKALIEMFISL